MFTHLRLWWNLKFVSRTLLNEVTKIHYLFYCRLDILVDGTVYARHLAGNLLFHWLTIIIIRFKNAVYGRGLAHITLNIFEC